MSPVVVTGATGFVGMELLARLLEQTDREVIALVRAGDDEEAQSRLDGVLDTLYGPDGAPDGGEHARAVAADMEQPGLGMDDAARTRLAEQATAVVHCAASVSFTLPLEEARRINVVGTRNVIDLAQEAQRAGALERFVHVSTAYVAGEREGRVAEDDGDLGQRTRNTYEQTKLEGEAAVWESGLPAAVLRPSIVVGESSTGWTPSFNVIYWPLQAFARGMFQQVPADPDGRLDIVPVDAVADALVALLEGPVRTGAFHVVSGDDAPTCKEVASLAAKAFGKEPPQFVPEGEDRSTEQRAGAFLPYFRVRCIFDDTRARSLGIEVPPVSGYFDALMQYAKDAGWGKRNRPRWEVAAAAR